MFAITISGHDKITPGITTTSKNPERIVVRGTSDTDFFAQIEVSQPIQLPLGETLLNQVHADDSLQKLINLREHLDHDINESKTRLITNAPKISAATLGEVSHIIGQRVVDQGANKLISEMYGDLRKLDEDIASYEKRFYEAELQSVNGKELLMTPAADARQDKRLLVFVDMQAGFKKNVKVFEPHGKLLVEGKMPGSKQSAEQKLILLDPGEEVHIRLRGVSGVQQIGFSRIWKWDGRNLILEQTATEGIDKNGTSPTHGEPFFGWNGIKNEIDVQKIVSVAKPEEKVAKYIRHLSKYREQASEVIEKQQAYATEFPEIMAAIGTMADQINKLHSKGKTPSFEEFLKSIRISEYRSNGSLKGSTFFTMPDEPDRKTLETISSHFNLKEIQRDYRISEARQGRIKVAILSVNRESVQASGDLAEKAQTWVIQPDGSLREPDFRTSQHYISSDAWIDRKPEELVLSFSSFNSFNNEKLFTVKHVPDNGITENQRQAAEVIRDDIVNKFGERDVAYKEGWKLPSEIIAFTSAINSEPKPIPPRLTIGEVESALNSLGNTLEQLKQFEATQLPNEFAGAVHIEEETGRARFNIGKPKQNKSLNEQFETMRKQGVSDVSAVELLSQVKEQRAKELAGKLDEIMELVDTGATLPDDLKKYKYLEPEVLSGDAADAYAFLKELPEPQVSGGKPTGNTIVI